MRKRVRAFGVGLLSVLGFVIGIQYSVLGTFRTRHTSVYVIGMRNTSVYVIGMRNTSVYVIGMRNTSVGVESCWFA